MERRLCDYCFKYSIRVEFHPAGKSASAEKPVRILVSRGKTIIEVIHEANRYNPGHHFMGHLGAIVISENIARAGMETLIDTLARNTEFMETADLYIARDMTAEDLLKKQPI